MASQKLKSDTTIKELETEITALTDQLIQSHQQNTHYDELMKQTAILQNSMQDLESQNDILRRTIESYESRFNDLQVNLEKVQFEVIFFCMTYSTIFLQNYFLGRFKYFWVNVPYIFVWIFIRINYCKFLLT